ncbi:MAG: tetratricopeptide repeat protein [Candidatus Omnitrophica bacterium]|nr:tetratricopeptide repeat protein [Candidatus Omnitrophota bacterium]
MNIKKIVQKGIELHEKGNYDKALEYYSKALQKHHMSDQGKAIIFFNMGISFWKKDDFKTTENYYLMAIEHDNELVPAYIDLGKLYYDLGRYEKAKKYFLRGLVLDPVCSFAFQGMAIVSYSLKDYSKAIHYAEKCLKHCQDEKLKSELKKLMDDCNMELNK